MDNPPHLIETPTATLRTAWAIIPSRPGNGVVLIDGWLCQLEKQWSQSELCRRDYQVTSLCWDDDEYEEVWQLIMLGADKMMNGESEWLFWNMFDICDQHQRQIM